MAVTVAITTTPSRSRLFRPAVSAPLTANTATPMNWSSCNRPPASERLLHIAPAGVRIAEPLVEGVGAGPLVRGGHGHANAATRPGVGLQPTDQRAPGAPRARAFAHH